MSVKINDKDLQKLLAKTGGDLKKQSQRGLALVANELRNIVVTNIQGGTARTGVLVKKRGKLHRRSAKGEYAKTDTGNLVSNIKIQRTKSGYTVESNAIYSERLEDLDRKVLTEPFEENSQKFVDMIVNETLRGY